MYDGIPLSGVTLSIRTTSSVSSPIITSLFVFHPNAITLSAPSSVELNGAEFEQFSPVRTGLDTIEICWHDTNGATVRTQNLSRWDEQAGVYTAVDTSSGLTSTSIPGGFAYCFTDSPRVGVAATVGFGVDYEIEICESGQCSDSTTSPGIYFYPQNLAVQNVALTNVTDTVRVPPMDVDGQFALTWTTPSYLQAG